MISSKYEVITFSSDSKEGLKEKENKIYEELIGEKSLKDCNLIKELQETKLSGLYKSGTVIKQESDKLNISKFKDNTKDNITNNTADKKVVFMFGGQGTQYKNMCKNLYDTIPFYKRVVEECLIHIESEEINSQVKEYLIGDKDDVKESATIIVQLAIFITEYAMAQLLIYCNIIPYALIGYSLGEYVAAVVSGTYLLEDTIKILIKRGELINKSPKGKMISVPLNALELQTILPEDVYLAIDNGVSCVVSGELSAIDAFEKKLSTLRIMCYPIESSHPLHSSILNSVKEEFVEYLSLINFNSPEIPMVSNVTGKWLDKETISTKKYWSEHLCATVQFDSVLKNISEIENVVFLEIGANRAISMLLFRYICCSLIRSAYIRDILPDV